MELLRNIPQNWCREPRADTIHLRHADSPLPQPSAPPLHSADSPFSKTPILSSVDSGSSVAMDAKTFGGSLSKKKRGTQSRHGNRVLYESVESFKIRNLSHPFETFSGRRITIYSLNQLSPSRPVCEKEHAPAAERWGLQEENMSLLRRLGKCRGLMLTK